MTRTRVVSFSSALVLTCAVTAFAQATLPKPTDGREQAISSLSGKAYGNIDFGGQFSSVTGDSARFQRYRDLRDGPLADNVLLNRRGETWTLRAAAVKPGYRDQRFTADYRLVGKVKAFFDWNQIPLFISSDTRTLYSEVSPGVFRLPDAMQASNQAGTTTIRDFVGSATQFDLRTRRDIGQFDFVYTANRDLDLKFNVTNTRRNGAIPYGASFGFSNDIELPAPIDQRTTDAKASLEWANRDALVSIGWDGSWFNNNVDAMIWDNPLKITDSPSYSSAYSDGRGPAQARMALWPDNTMQYVHGTGSFSTPARGRLTAYLAVGASKQNEALLPHTINSLIPVVPLARPTAEAEIRNTMFNVLYVARPFRPFMVNARYRYNDLDNRTPPFEMFGRVRFDGVLDDASAAEPPEFYSVKRENFDVDGTFSGLPFTSIKVGYGSAISDRTFRIFEKTNENTFRVSADSTGNRYVTLRALFENSVRTGKALDEELLIDIGEQPGMRHFDIADRDRKRFTLIATVMPISTLGFNASAAVAREDYPESEFGLRDVDSNQYSAGVDFLPSDRVGVNLTYAWERYGTLSASRTASPGDQFTDPRRNWFTDYAGKVSNIDAVVDLAAVAPKTDVRLTINWSDVKDTYTYLLAPQTTLPAPSQLAPVLNELFRGTVDVTHRLTNRLRLGASYWYEDYNTEDFALGELTLTDIALPAVQPGVPVVPTSTLLLGYIYRPFTAHTGIVRLTYLW